MTVREIATTAYSDQKPGTAGLRKKVRVFAQPHYLENFVQSIFDCVPTLRGATLVIGGDGRYHNREAIQTVLAMAAANGVARAVVGQHGLLSTPAASHLIRTLDAAGGFLLTASHNPAGPDGDFGIKFNVRGGGQASETLTRQIHEQSQHIHRYVISDAAAIDIDTLGSHTVEAMQVEIIDSVEAYAELMQSLFDFEAMRAWLRQGHRICFDAMHAVTGPYARRILVEQLGARAEAVLGGVPLEDFGGGHPDPNLVYARHLADLAFGDDAPDLIAASDGDGDRNMILGRGIFISPGDSLAMLAAHLHRLPGYRSGLRGIARSMPTSRAADRVAQALNIPLHETPTGWKFFCNLLDADQITLCGEESFGTSSAHAREKDGLWAVLAWLNVLAASGSSVQQIATRHWQRFGRHYYQRHDYEDLSHEAAQAIMHQLQTRLPTLVGQSLGAWTVSQADSFTYHDPVDGSVAGDQGLRIICADEARIVVRLSGTGTQGATLRLYLERYVSPQGDLAQTPEAALAELAARARDICQLEALSGRTAPTLVT